MNINPGGFSMIQAELDAMEYLLNVSSEWDFFINLSGDDYPLKKSKYYTPVPPITLIKTLFSITIRNFTDPIHFKESKTNFYRIGI